MALVQIKRKARSYNLKTRTTEIEQDIQCISYRQTPESNDKTEETNIREKDKRDEKMVTSYKFINGISGVCRRSTDSKTAHKDRKRSKSTHSHDINLNNPVYASTDTYCHVKERKGGLKLRKPESYKRKNKVSEPISVNGLVEADDGAGLIVHWPAPPPPPEVDI